MKFTDGFWVVKPGISLYNCQVVDTRWMGDSFVVYCSHQPLHHRGQTLNAPLITLTFTAPREGIIAVKAEHFQGVNARAPAFQLNTDRSRLRAEEREDLIILTSGALSAKIVKSKFSLDFYEQGARLTGLKDRHLGYAVTPSGPHMRVKLDVGVGEKVYGLGERFTPYVRNGQTVDIWNEDGGTASQLAYKNIPFYLTNRTHACW